MPEDRLRYVVCYDIPDDRRRTRLAKHLEGFGDRMQYSVFETLLDRARFAEMISGVEDIICCEKDSVIVIPLCAACHQKRLRLGAAARESDYGDEIVFIV